MIDGITGKNIRGCFDKIRAVFYIVIFRKKKWRIRKISGGGIPCFIFGFNDGFDTGKSVQGGNRTAKTSSKLFLIACTLGHSGDMLDGITKIDPAVSVGVFRAEMRKTRKKDQRNKKNA